MRNSGVLSFLCALPLLAVQHTGSVRSAGQPIPGAAVAATQDGQTLTTTTDESGLYTLDIPPGTWAIEVQIFGFASQRRQLTLDASLPAPPPPFQWILELQPRPAVAQQQQQGQQRRAAAFQNLNLNPTGESEPAADGAVPPAPETTTTSSNANEAFLVNGSISQGLEAQLQNQQEDAFSMRRRDSFDRREGPPGLGGPEGGSSGAFGGGPPSRGGFSGRGGGPDGFGGSGGPEGRGRRRYGSRSSSSSTFGNRRGGGRDQIRGGAYFSLRNSALDARPLSLTGQSVERPAYGQSIFGLSMGGMLNIPKVIRSESTFFFLNYYGVRGRSPYYSAFATVPTPLERTGDFSQSFAHGPVSLFDPTTHAPLPGNRIPASRIDPAASGLLPFIPLPNLPGSIQNYQYLTSVPQNTDNLSLRVNHNLTQRDRLDGSFNMQLSNQSSEQLYQFRDQIEGTGRSLSLGWSHSLSRRAVNNLRWTFSRSSSNTVPFFAYGPNVAAELGITGVSSDPINYGPPNLQFTNFGSLTDASPALRRNQTSSVSDGIQFTRGSHNLSFGGEFRRMQINQRTDQNARGTFSFSGLATSAFDSNGLPLAASGYDLADFLFGLPQSSSVRFGDTSTYFRGTVMSGYTADDWRPRSNLTFNLGLRYEFFPPFHEKYNRIANLDVAPGFTAVAVVTPGSVGPYSGRFPDGLVDADKNNLSPRLGFAWRPAPKGKLVIRGGYGIHYNGSIYTQFPARLASQPPFASTATLTTSLARVLTIEDGFPTLPSRIITNSYAVDRYYRTGYAQTWNLTLQEELPHSLIVELGYLGTKGTRLDIQRLPNRAAPGSPLTAEQRRQIGNAVGFTFDSSDGNSIYHAAQVRLTRRFRSGISANVLYTYSKSIDNASTLGGGGAVVAQDDKDLRAERGLSSFDRRHTLSVFYLFSTSMGRDGISTGGSLKSKLLADWSLSGGVTAQSGLPFTARVLGNQENSGGTGSIGSGRADATGLPIDGAPFFNLLAFTIPPSGRFGNAGRNTIEGPGLFSLSASLTRSFRLGADDRRRVEFRLSATNLTNHPSITGMNTVVNASSYGLATDAASMRTLTATLRFRF